MKKILIIAGTTSLLLLSACGTSTESSTEPKTEVDGVSTKENTETSISPEKEFTSGSEQATKINITSKELTKETDCMILDIVVPQIEGLKNKEKQAELNEYFTELGKAVEQETRKAEEGLVATIQEGQELHAEGIVKYEVKLLNENMISILLDEYVYSGGAHGTPIKIGFTYDVKEDKELMLKDLFNDEKYVHLVSEIVKKEFENGEHSDLYFNDFEHINENQSFYVTETALVLIFSQYEYTAGAAGSPEISIPKDQLSILKEHYR